MQRQRNPRSLRLFAAQTEDDNVLITLPGGTSSLYTNAVYGPTKGGRFSAQLIWTAGPTGAFTLQYSLKPYPNEATDADWVPDTTVTVIGTALAVAGGSGNTIIFGGNVLPEWWRIKWLASSGSASTVQGFGRYEGDSER